MIMELSDALEVHAGRRMLGTLWLTCRVCETEELLGTGTVDVPTLVAKAQSHTHVQSHEVVTRSDNE